MKIEHTTLIVLYVLAIIDFTVCLFITMNEIIMISNSSLS